MDIALAVGGSFLSSFLQVLFDRMATPDFLNLFRQQKYDYRILEKLKWKLLILQAVLDDAESKQSKNLAVNKWLEELQEVVYQADDLLDQINTEALWVKVETEYGSSTNQMEKNSLVISVVGLGGIGKPTLAQFVYDDERLENHFDVKAWVCVSEEYDPLRITKLILHQVTQSSYDPNETDMNLLQKKLKQDLSNKNFLLVLDDVWNRNYEDWLMISKPFKYGKAGSRITVTTRDEKVALTVGAQHIHHLNLMSEEDCWSLFRKQALINRNSEFESIGKDIVKKAFGSKSDSRFVEI